LTDEVVGLFKVEEGKVAEVVVFGRLEDVQGDAVGRAGLFVDGMEEGEEELLPISADLEKRFKV
jgi:hypothetical protein